MIEPRDPEPPVPAMPEGLDDAPHTAEIYAMQPRRRPLERFDGARVPPHNLEAEETVLGSLLLSRAAQAEVLPHLSADHFYRPAHSRIYEAIIDVLDRGEAADSVTVADELRRSGRIEDVGGAPYIHTLVSSVPTAANARFYAKIVSELATLRHLIDTATQIAAEAYEMPEDVASVVARAQAALTLVPADGADRALLPVQSMRELLAEVDAMPAPRYLLRPVWAEDAYGVLAAEPKAGKTWLMLDAAVSVASGTSWLGMYECPAPGPCLLFTGEGGKRKVVRRLRAIAAQRDLVLDDLPIHVVARAPHLTDAAYLSEIRTLLGRIRPRFVAIDPLYLAARGAKGSDLYEMGEHLEAVQLLTQDVGAALMIVHHWNKTGQGKGHDRMSGVGPGAWGRVLVSVNVERRAQEGPASVVTLGLAFTGDETSEESVRIRRRIWSDDAGDLASAMHYVVERLADPVDDGEHPGLKPNQRRVLAALSVAELALTVGEIGDALAHDETAIPLKERTIQVILGELSELGLATSMGRGPKGTFWAAGAHAPSVDEGPEDGANGAIRTAFGPEGS